MKSEKKIVDRCLETIDNIIYLKEGKSDLDQNQVKYLEFVYTVEKKLLFWILDREDK